MLHSKLRIVTLLLIISVMGLCFPRSMNDVQAVSGQIRLLQQEEPMMKPLLTMAIKPLSHKKEVDKQESSLPRTNARASALVDVTSGRVLYSEHGDEQLPMASTTKIMTAIVAIEHGKLNDKVKVNKSAVGKEGSSIYLRLNEEMTLEHLLYGLMLRSGNDAAVAIAEHVGGSEEGFVYLMNKKANDLGLQNTQFRNPHGLDASGHYTSAKDLAKLSAYALHNETFRTIVRTKQKSAPNPFEQWDYRWANKNKMLRFYEGADGVKTGYTSGALRCLVSSATRNGQQLTVVTLNDGSDWVDHERMLNYGFAHYPLRSIVKQDQLFDGYPYRAVKDIRVPLTDNELGEVTYQVKLITPRSLDYRLGKRGQVDIMLHDERLTSVQLKE